MPPAIVAALIGAGVSGTEMGLQASGALTPSSAPTAQQLEQERQQQTQQQQQIQAMRDQSMRAAAANQQENIGGNVSQGQLAQIIAEMTGSPMDIGVAQQTVFGTQPTGLASTGGIVS